MTPGDHLSVRMLADPSSLKEAVHSPFGALSGYTHLSKRQLNEGHGKSRAWRVRRLESAKTLEHLTDCCPGLRHSSRAHLEGVAPAFTGDVFGAVSERRFTLNNECDSDASSVASDSDEIALPQPQAPARPHQRTAAGGSEPEERVV